MTQQSRAKIINGIWKRNVPNDGGQGGRWRFNISKKVLDDPRLRECHFYLKSGPTVLIPIDDLRPVVVNGPVNEQGRKWGPFNIEPNEGTIAGRAVRMRVIREDDIDPNDSPEIAQLKQQLDELQALPQTPETLRKIRRVLKTYERPNSITRYMKQACDATCELCGEPGFVKRNGTRYCEIHHLFHLAKNPPPKCITPEYLVVLCATCHRRMHYADVGDPVRDGDGWLVRVVDSERRFSGHRII